MNKKQILSICAAVFASQLLASTIYIGSDGNFYDANTGGTQVSYTSGDTIDWQTGVTTWNVNSVTDVSDGSFATATDKTISVGAGGDFTATIWQYSLGKTASINVSEGGSFSQTISLEAGQSTTVNYKTIELSGTNTARSTFTFVKSGTGSMYMAAVYKIGEYVDFKAEDFYLSTSGGSSFAANSTYKFMTLQASGKLTINADSGSIEGTSSHINAMDSAYFVVNTANPFKNKMNLDVCRKVYDITTGEGSETVVKKASTIIELHSNLDLGRLDFTRHTSESKTLLLDLNGNQITFSNASGTGMADVNDLALTGNYTMKILIEDFANESVRFGTKNGLLTNDDGSLKNIFWLNEAGEEIALYQNSEGWLYTTVAVPEPAEWAMIFGVIALGFVAYRRRK